MRAYVCVQASISAPKSRYHLWKHEFHTQVTRVVSGVGPGRERSERGCGWLPFWGAAASALFLAVLAMSSGIAGEAAASSRAQEAAPQRAAGWDGRSCVFVQV